jgi:BirA family biotin operon repressor/biotin-[acetyl-CoA-carboxylase] ligase
VDACKVECLLRQSSPIRCYNDIDSTNASAKAWALEGAPHGAAVLADHQLAGRGRMGHSYYSPPGGLYMSIILDTGNLPPGMVTTLAAVSMLASVQTLTGQQLKIKWVNDLLFEGRKVCGILAERLSIQGQLNRVVLGIGINTVSVAFPQEIADTAGTLAREGESLDREWLAAAIINELMAGLTLSPRHLNDYRAHCVTLGRQVQFTHDGKPRTGIARDVDISGALLVDTAEGSLRLEAGEVSIRGIDGGYF